MLASKSWHLLSDFQSENGYEYSRWTVKEVFPVITAARRELPAYDAIVALSGALCGELFQLPSS